MDSETKLENDEDESVGTEANDGRNAALPDVSWRPQSAAIAKSSGNSSNKRVLSESSSFNSVIVEEDRSEHISKRMRIEAAQPIDEGEQGACGCGTEQSSSGTVDIQVADAEKEAFPVNCSDGSLAQPNVPSPPCDCSVVGALSLKTDSGGREFEQEMTSLDPERDSPSPLEERKVSCSSGNVDTVLKFSTCGHSCSCSDLEKNTECHVEQPKEQSCCHCSHKTENSSAFPVPLAHTHGPQKVFSCDLCGFQCVEENLLHTHHLGKTHLRRQNLAARGGFVQILTKQHFPKKTCIMGTKNIRTKPRGKPIAKYGDSIASKNTGSLSEQGCGSSELPVCTLPSSSSSSEKVDVCEDVPSLGVTQHPESQSKQVEGLGSPQDLLSKSESTQNVLQTAQRISAILRPRPERSLVMLGHNIRRRSGTFTLKGQSKKRFSLLGVNKRGTSETQRMYVKHFRTQAKPGDSQPALKHGQMSNIVHGLCGTISEVIQDKTPSCPSCSTQLGSLTEKPASNQQASCASAACRQVAMDKTDLKVHVKSCYPRETPLHCQPCDFSGMSRKDLEDHQHRTSALSCQSCPFTTLSEGDLRDHMKEAHGLSGFCTSCDLFLSEKDAEEHRATEKRNSSMGHSKITVSNSDSVLPLSSSESESTQGARKESGKTTSAQEESVRSRISHVHEVRHSSKPQFQCKKCFYKTRSSTVLTRHIKLRHGQDYHFLCKACNLYSLSKEGMEKHIKRSKHLENAKKNNIGLSFEECIERVCIGANDRREDFNITGNGRPEGHVGVQSEEHSCLDMSILTPKELTQSGVITKENELILATTPKRGRPKGSISRTCSHCGLLASSITNLTVHIRRKHSHQYSYLCKVCKYYTVTKGDMERHCATKKHKGRVEIEANGKHNSDIIVGPEGGHLEACKKNTHLAVAVSNEQSDKSAELDASALEKPVVDHGNPAEVEVESVFHSVSGEVSGYPTDSKGPVSLEQEELLQQGTVCPQRDLAAAGSDNRCLHCEFSAHSSASLELHVKRKHTKEFEFYCMACDYYAVTRREMTRHAATEKHRMKRQSYLSSSDVEAVSSEVSGNVLTPEGEHAQHTEEFQVISERPSGTLKSRNAASCSILDESPNLDISKVLCAPDTVEIVTEEDSNLSENHHLCETLQSSIIKDKTVKPEEIVVPLASSNYGTPGCFQSENSESSAVNLETDKKNRDVMNNCGDSGVQCEGSGGRVEDSGCKVLHKTLHPLVLADGHSAECPSAGAMGITKKQSDLGNSGQNKVGCDHNSGGRKNEQTELILENKEVLVNSQHEAEVVLEEDGPASDGTVDASDVYETIISIDDKGQTMYSFSRFDSSIIRIKNSEDGELTDQSEEGLKALGVRTSELPLRDCTQGLKKKKVESSSFAETTRIRCDDCGFLADGLSGLNVHIAMKHPTKEKHFHCLLCGKSFYTESNLHQHLASAGHMRNEQASVEELPEGGATFKCVKCTEPFDSEQNLFLHIKGQHEELLREVNKYIVEDTEQINREREENQGNVCKYCGKMCRSSNSMAFLAHIRTHTGSKPFKCKICHFATAQLGDARNHVKRHLGMREYKCHVCGVAFVMKKHLNTHLLGKHGVGTPKERKFTCHLCDRSFTEKWALNNHMKLHTGEKPFKCTWPTCHYSFLTASAMKDHYRTHTGEKSFLCDLCGFAGGTRHALTKHRRQHTGEKPFKCDECNFASTTQSHLTRHKRVHTGEKPYRCPWCDYRSNCAENIRKHILHTGKHEGVKMYNCPKCDYGTNIPVEFRNHLKEQHPDIENPDLAYLHAGKRQVSQDDRNVTVQFVHFVTCFNG